MNDTSYNDWAAMSDITLIETIGKFVQYHRLNQNKSQHDVARDADISRSTLSLLERGEKISLINLIRILRVLDLLHIMEVFKIKHQISPIEYAKLQRNKRQRARSKDKGSGSSDDLGW